MEAYKNGLVDRTEVLKKTEIFDKEGVMQRFDYISQLEQQLEQASEQIKDLEGDLQTRDRENVNLKQRVEVEKFKTGLDKVSNKASAASTLYEKRLDDSLAGVKKSISDATKKDSSPRG
jgi:regulator of replication initiation timing